MKTKRRTAKRWAYAVIIVSCALLGTVVAVNLAPQVGQWVTQNFDLPSPTHGAITHNTIIYVGSEERRVVGTDLCGSSLPEPYRCWKFSLTPGDQQMLFYSNGQRERLTTRAAKGSAVSLTTDDGRLVRIGQVHRALFSLHRTAH